MKKRYLIIALLAFTFTVTAQSKLYKEPHRPQFHFSPATNWCNDPNGLVYNNGLYHLFYQFNPFGNIWGHMTWAHATSEDLVHWKHLPVAIPEENGIMIFSGTCVVDKNNTSGFGKNGKAPMVAVYTGHIENVNQSQHIAYSLDDGISWMKYANNPVLDLGKKDFRDPKIFWYEPKKYWVMAVVLSVEHIVQFYSSRNLKNWKLLSEFGPVGDTTAVWECPDLTLVPVEGMPGKKKWLLQTSQNAQMQYFAGDFDGVKFVNESGGNKIYRPDYGPDYYAAIAFAQLPAAHKPTGLGWLNNWNYANDIPTTPWKGAMAIPRTLSLKKINNEWILLQKPVALIASLRKEMLQLPDMAISGKKVLPIKGKQFEMEFLLEPGISSVAGARIAVNENNYFEIGYDAAKAVFYIDRSKVSNTDFSKNFKGLSRFEKNIPLRNNKIQVSVFFDHSIAEIFVNGGEAVFTAQLFPGEKEQGIELFSLNKKSTVRNFKLWKMKGIW